MQVQVVFNLAAGEGQTEHLLEEHVKPMLSGWMRANPGHGAVTFQETDALLGARQVGRAVAQRAAAGPCAVVILGGDGTMHEVLEGMMSSDAPALAHDVGLVLVPTGTANALYHAYFPDLTESDTPSWRLASLRAFVQGDVALSELRRLTLMHAEPGAHTAAVVCSQALHAAILRDSEVLRASVPGVERFKMAAAQNMLTWCHARLILRPGAQGKVLEYDAKTQQFVPARAMHGECIALENGELHVFGEFVYMNAMTIDRLEATFVPAPFAGPHGAPALRRPDGMMDIVVVRPPRSPKVLASLRSCRGGTSIREAFAQDVLQKVLYDGMYNGGSHVEFTYTDDGEVERLGRGPPVVEYYRASGYEWQGAADDLQAHSVCMDGTINVAAHVRVSASASPHVRVYH